MANCWIQMVLLEFYICPSSWCLMGLLGASQLVSQPHFQPYIRFSFCTLGSFSIAFVWWSKPLVSCSYLPNPPSESTRSIPLLFLVIYQLNSIDLLYVLLGTLEGFPAPVQGHAALRSVFCLLWFHGCDERAPGWRSFTGGLGTLPNPPKMVHRWNVMNWCYPPWP